MAKTKELYLSRSRQNYKAANAGSHFFHHPKANFVCVMTARKKALRENGKSFLELPPGIARCEGEFSAEDVVRICDLDGTEFACAASRVSVPPPCAGKIYRRKNWFIVMTW